MPPRPDTRPALHAPPVAWQSPDARLLVLGVLAAATVAWALLAVGVGHQHAGPVTPIHSGHHHGAPGTAVALAPGVLWFLGWVLMVVAMMLPPALPLLLTMRRLARRHVTYRALVMACAAGFLTVWAAAGLVLMAGGAALGALAGQWAWLAARPHLLSGAAAVAAGAYQFTPLKKACLTACRSPLGLAMQTWTGTRPRTAEAALLGARFGLVCVGCCWALMVLTFTIGTAALPVMVAAGVLMTVERLAPRVRPLVPAVAGVAITAGVLIMLGILPAGLRA